jgi:hypothetical protein
MTELLVRELMRRHDDLEWRQGSTLSRVARFALVAAGWSTSQPGVHKKLVAQALGMRAETLSRGLAALEAKGFISRGPMLRVLDPAGLAATGALW